MGTVMEAFDEFVIRGGDVGEWPPRVFGVGEGREVE